MGTAQTEVVTRDVIEASLTDTTSYVWFQEETDRFNNTYYADYTGWNTGAAAQPSAPGTYWYYDSAASDHTEIGDYAFVLAIVITYMTFRSVNFDTIFSCSPYISS